MTQKEIAIQVMANNKKISEVWITSDNIAFADEKHANSHAVTRKDKKVNNFKAVDVLGKARAAAKNGATPSAALKPLKAMNLKELAEVADALGIDVAAMKTKAERITAIELAKAGKPTPAPVETVDGPEGPEGGEGVEGIEVTDAQEVTE